MSVEARTLTHHAQYTDFLPTAAFNRHTPEIQF